MTLLASRFRSRRLELKLSQSELAEGICKQGQISRIEKGKYNPGSDILYKLAQKLNVPMEYFFDENILADSSTLGNFIDLSKKLLNQCINVSLGLHAKVFNCVNNYDKIILIMI